MGRYLTGLLAIEALERITRALLDEHELTDHDIRALAAEPVVAAA